MRRDSKTKPRCDDCTGNGKRHVCGMGACVDFDEPCPGCKGTGRRDFYQTNVLVTPDVMRGSLWLTDLKDKDRRREIRKSAAMQDIMVRLGRKEILERILTRTTVSLFGKIFKGARIAKDIVNHIQNETTLQDRVFPDTDETYFGKPSAPETSF